MRRAARIDASQDEIVAAFRSMGASVEFIKLPLDLIVGYRGHTIVVECKVWEKTKSGRKMSAYKPSQLKFFETWKGGPVATVCDAEGAIRLLKSLEPAL